LSAEAQEGDAEQLGGFGPNLHVAEVVGDDGTFQRDCAGAYIGILGLWREWSAVHSATGEDDSYPREFADLCKRVDKGGIAQRRDAF
jgi:hypothetical protein